MKLYEGSTQHKWTLIMLYTVGPPPCQQQVEDILLYKFNHINLRAIECIN